MPFQFPINDAAEIPHWVLFEAAEYSVLSLDRTRSAISARAYDYIQLPLPLGIQIATEHGYSEGANPVGPMLSAAGEANAGSSAALFKRAFIDPVLTVMEGFATTSTQQSFSNITEMSLQSEARREFNLVYLFTPKDFGEAQLITEICDAFRTNSYPTATEVPERILPAPLWRLQVMGEGDSEYLTRAWFGDPLICVLTNVSINKIPFGEADTARFFQDGSPMATTLSLKFKEFETGTYYNGRVVSKSEINELTQGGTI